MTGVSVIMAGVGVPVKLLHESIGLIVSIEVKTGQLYRGKLVEVEDCMNLHVHDVTVVNRDGSASSCEHCIITGRSIKFVAVPKNLRHAPMFKNFAEKDAKGRTRIKGIGMGKARAEIARAQAIRGGRGGLSSVRGKSSEN